MATLATPTEALPPTGPLQRLLFHRPEWLVLLFALAIFGVGIAAPPYLMDDVDSVQAVIARDMLRSGDWVTPHINGIAYLEKPPFKYWLMSISFGIFPLRFNQSIKGEVLLVLVGLGGEELYRRSLFDLESDHVEDISMEGYVAGSYVLRVISSEHRQDFKISKLAR